MRILLPDAAGLAEALIVLRSGGTVAHATETCYGFACDMTNVDAVNRLFQIKQRPVSQPISALFPSVNEAKQYVEWTDRAEELAQKHLPGPLTLILLLKTQAPHLLLPVPGGSPTVGIRVSPHPVALALSRGYRHPISTTSANLHGQPNPYSAQDIQRQYKEVTLQPDLILDSGTLPPSPSSTVVNLTTEEPGTVRAGNIRL